MVEQTCVFCESIAQRQPDLFYEDESGLFAVLWDAFPLYPGHALVVPKRHIARFDEMNEQEMQQIAKTVLQAKEKISAADLRAVYEGLEPVNEGSGARIASVKAALQQVSGPPEAFNDGINDGAAAGQVVPHLHWHVVPRWSALSGKGIISMVSEQKL